MKQSFRKFGAGPPKGLNKPRSSLPTELTSMTRGDAVTSHSVRDGTVERQELRHRLWRCCGC
jgi:hypothetical protein